MEFSHDKEKEAPIGKCTLVIKRPRSHHVIHSALDLVVHALYKISIAHAQWVKGCLQGDDPASPMLVAEALPYSLLVNP